MAASFQKPRISFLAFESLHFVPKKAVEDQINGHEICPHCGLLRRLQNPNSCKIKNPILRTVEKLLKQSKKGREIMSTSFQKLIDRKEAEAARNAAKKARREARREIRQEVKQEIRQEVKREIKQEVTKKVREETSNRIKNESIRNYFRKGGDDPSFIADVLGTSVKHVLSIQKKMQKRPA